MIKRTIVALASVLALAGCGGGSEPPKSALWRAAAGHAYTPVAGTQYSYAPHAGGSRFHYNLLGEFHIGSDVEPRERLDLIDRGRFNIYMGASRDGVGVDRLKNYEKDLLSRSFRNGFVPFSGPPVLFYDPDFDKPENEDMWSALFDSVGVLNDALPPEFQIRWGGPATRSTVSRGEILVSLEGRSSIAANCGAGALACAFPSLNRALVRLPDDMDMAELIYPRSIIVHELLHALGVRGHVDSVEFPDSILGTYGGYIPNGRHIISKIDREVLQIMYMSQLTAIYNDWGEWSDTSFHLMVESEDEAMRFGVALFNGLPQPWARGDLPETELADNRSLRGRASWKGALVGFSGPSPLVGGAELQVNMATLAIPDSEHDLRFRNIAYLNRFETPDRSATAPLWFSARDIDYKIKVFGNAFLNVQGPGQEEGWITGGFMGAEHEHMAGTVKRTDMVAAFGGSR